MNFSLKLHVHFYCGNKFNATGQKHSWSLACVKFTAGCFIKFYFLAHLYAPQCLNTQLQNQCESLFLIKLYSCKQLHVYKTWNMFYHTRDLARKVRYFSSVCSKQNLGIMNLTLLSFLLFRQEETQLTF